MKKVNASIISAFYQLPNFLAVKAILYPIRASIFNVGVLLCGATLLLAMPLIANILFAVPLLHVAISYFQYILIFKCFSKFCSWYQNECYRYDVDTTTLVISKGLTISECVFESYNKPTDALVSEGAKVVEGYFQVIFRICHSIFPLFGIRKPISRGFIWRHNIEITTLNIAEGVIIDNEAFFGCKGIAKLNIAEGVTIGRASFLLCTDITELNIAKGVTIGEQAFWACRGITKVNVAKDVIISHGAFWTCPAITELNIAQGVVIGASAFLSCTGITKLNIAKDAVISDYAFARCTGITELNIAEGVTISNSDVFSSDSIISVNTFRYHEFFNQLPANCRVVRRALSFLPSIGASLNTLTYTIAERNFMKLVYMLANRLRSNGSGLVLPNELWDHIIRHCRVEYLPKLESEAHAFEFTEDSLNQEDDLINQYKTHCRQYM